MPTVLYPAMMHPQQTITARRIVCEPYFFCVCRIDSIGLHLCVAIGFNNFHYLTVDHIAAADNAVDNKDGGENAVSPHPTEKKEVNATNGNNAICGDSRGEAEQLSLVEGKPKSRWLQ